MNNRLIPVRARSASRQRFRKVAKSKQATEHRYYKRGLPQNQIKETRLSRTPYSTKMSHFDKHRTHATRAPPNHSAWNSHKSWNCTREATGSHTIGVASDFTLPFPSAPPLPTETARDGKMAPKANRPTHMFKQRSCLEATFDTKSPATASSPFLRSSSSSSDDVTDANQSPADTGAS